ncbi:MAG: hypothetical protein LUQ17_00090 [Methanomicrobiales archaeon]|nr:hypothetical protein [Methanomicrobiales archaeon]
MEMRPSWILILLAIGLLTFCTGCFVPSGPPGSEVTREFGSTYDVSRASVLEVKNINGAVNIVTGDQDILQVNATLSSLFGTNELDKVQISVLTDQVVRVETRHSVPDPRVSVEYRIIIPRNLSLGSVESSNGGLSVRDARGTTQLVTSNGAIRVSSFSGDLIALSSNGAITIEDVAGNVSARTSNAAIAAHRVRHLLALETSNGQITADILSAETGVSIVTSNARVDIGIAPDIDADIDVSTSNGRIHYAGVPIIVRESTDTTLKGILGSGGDTISVLTSNADVEMRMVTVS